MPVEGLETAFPSQFGRYTLVQRLATGGMAEVFKAKILSTHGFEKLLVIKRILPNLAADKTFVSMFIDEAKLTAQLIHPKIVQVTDFGEENGQYFIALEFVDGFDGLALLRSAAQKHVHLPLPICMFIASEVLDALDYAHNAKDSEGKPMHLVHRDISPSNVFIARRGDVKLGDFGIAHAQERESKTQAGTLKGKYGYMSPEQVTGAELDGRSDIFAVGIVLAEMLMGKRLFTAPNDLDVLLMVRDGRLERWDKYGKDIPASLDAIVRKALAKNLAERFQTAADFRNALEDLQFKFGMRVGPADVGLLAADLFDSSPEGLARLKEHARKWEVKAAAPPVPQAPAPATAPQSAAPSGFATSSKTPPPLPMRPPTMERDARTPSHMSPPEPASTVVGAALDDALAGSMSLVELDQYETPMPTPASGASPFMASSPSSARFRAPDSAQPPPPPPRGQRPPSTSGKGGLRTFPSPNERPNPGRGRGVRSEAEAIPQATARETTAEVMPADYVPPPVAGAVPDNSGDLSLISPMRAIADLAVAADTGLIRFHKRAQIKDVYLVRGAPESVNSNMNGDRFGEYLVTRGFLRSADMERALAEMPRFGGKFGEALVGLGFMRPLDVFRLLSQHVRERVMELFTWSEGGFDYYRHLRNPTEAFPLGLNSFEILGAGVVSMSYDFLVGHFEPLMDFHPRAMPNPRVSPEAFKLGPTPREVLGLLDGTATLRAWAERFTSPDELLTFYRTLYLLVESSMAQFE
jgi:serine/threonine protein kinase